jgi:molecular chaperone GrpE (heat shock protein)
VAAYVEEHGLNLLPRLIWREKLKDSGGDLQNERDRNPRGLADFKNYRRRIERDGGTLAEEGKRAIFLPLFDIIGDIEKALHWVSNEKQPSAKLKPRPVRKGYMLCSIPSLSFWSYCGFWGSSFPTLWVE